MYNNIYNKLKRLLKVRHYQNIIDENKSYIKNTWKILTSAMGKQTNKQKLPTEF